MSEDKLLNEVIRVQRKPSNFVMMDKGFLENPNLSWKSKGILAYLLSKPDNWKVVARDLVNHATDGKSAVYSGLNELKLQGHYKKYSVRDNEGRRISHWEGTISEVPMESLENTPLSLLPDFQEIENQEIENQDIENRERSNNNSNNNQSSQVLSATPDRQDKTDSTAKQIEAYTSLLRENISYSSFEISRPHDIKLVDEFIAIIIDAIMTKGETVHIGREDKPRALVTANLLRLNYDDIEHTLDQFKGITERINNKKQYVLTMLYNCKLELDAHYTNLVNHDKWQ